MSHRCPGVRPAKPSVTGDTAVRVACEGTAREYHLSPAHPHLFCGCGTDTDTCHPGWCCVDDDYGTCTECGKPAPEPDPTPEAELSDPLWAD